jgi:predicted dehydrogenase/threonine dehydrogenase-like Zn-dependent dehydrogenase
MKQIVQNLKNGETLLIDVPVPEVKKGHVLIKTSKTLVSVGTEKMLVEFSKANLITKVKQQPEKVKQVIQKIKTEGLISTLEAVYRKLDEPLPLGYCNVGKIVEVGEDITDLKLNDRVVSNGPHAEFVCIPKNLCAKIPDNVCDDEAVFTVVASIGLQGIRLAQPTIGETFVVIGLGLIGLLTCNILLANGCRVIGYDLDEHKIELAKNMGVLAFNPLTGNNPVITTLTLTQQVGADGVIITASSTDNTIIRQAAQMARKRGRIILVGVVGLNLNRSDFYEKELTFQVSCSYGPGRYDVEYEKKGIDYPIAYVRWTEKRNFETILQLLEQKKLNVKPLISEKVKLENYLQIYEQLGKKNNIASILEYSSESPIERTIINKAYPTIQKNSTKNFALIGAGNYVKMTLLPLLKKINFMPKVIVSESGVSASNLSKKYKIPVFSSSFDETLKNDDITAVIITTQHHMHAKMVLEALKANKHVFVEKPVAIHENDLNEINNYIKNNNHLKVWVGFNRRYSPYALKAKSLLGEVKDGICMNFTINAGFVPLNSWVHDMEIGGGRIIGEACHFVDLFVYLCNSNIVSVYAEALGNSVKKNSDSVSVLLKAANGSIGTINYFANGNKMYPKERIEIFSNGKILIIDNFRKLETYGFKPFSGMKGKLDKGHKHLLENFKNFINDEKFIFTNWDELYNISLATIKIVESFMYKKTIII